MQDTLAKTPGRTTQEYSPWAMYLAPSEHPGDLGSLAHYRVLSHIGSGGMGCVFLALDTRLERRVALKLMSPYFTGDEKARQRFLIEARSAARINHEHVVTIHEVNEVRGLPYLAMEYLQGQSLEERLADRGLPNLAETLRIMHGIFSALAAAHAKNLVHRDIKPANVWLESGKDKVKVLDFGLAVQAELDQKVTASGIIVGTPMYMSPEQARGEMVDARSDLFSAGVVLYQMLTSRLPFRGATPLAVLMQIIAVQPRWPRERNPRIPEPLDAFVRQLMSKNPNERFASAADALQSLEQLQSSLIDFQPVECDTPFDAGETVALGTLQEALGTIGVAMKINHQTNKISRRKVIARSTGIAVVAGTCYWGVQNYASWFAKSETPYKLHFFGQVPSPEAERLLNTKDRIEQKLDGVHFAEYLDVIRQSTEGKLNVQYDEHQLNRMFGRPFQELTLNIKTSFYGLPYRDTLSRCIKDLTSAHDLDNLTWEWRGNHVEIIPVTQRTFSLISDAKYVDIKLADLKMEIDRGGGQMNVDYANSKIDPTEFMNKTFRLSPIHAPFRSLVDAVTNCLGVNVIAYGQCATNMDDNKEPKVSVVGIYPPQYVDAGYITISLDTPRWSK